MFELFIDFQQKKLAITSFTKLKNLPYHELLVSLHLEQNIHEAE